MLGVAICGWGMIIVLRVCEGRVDDDMNDMIYDGGVWIVGLLILCVYLFVLRSHSL